MASNEASKSPQLLATPFYLPPRINANFDFKSVRWDEQAKPT